MMKLTIEIPEELVEWMIKEVMQNMPEASAYACLRCTRWDYDNCIFDFIDSEDGSKFTVDYPKLRKGFEALIQQRMKGKANFYGWNIEPLNNPSKEAWGDWACQWDADVVDGLVQCALFGEIIYG